MGLPLPVLRRPAAALVLSRPSDRLRLLAVAASLLACAPAAAFPYTLAWKRLVGTPPPESLLEAGEVTVFGEADGTVTAVRRSDGLRLWRGRPGGPVGPGLTAADSLAFVADRWGHVLGLRLGSGAVAWSTRRTGWGDSWAAVHGRRLLVAGGDGVLYGLDAASGVEVWRVRTGTRPRGAPAIAGRRLYAATSEGELIALDLDSGRRVESAALDGPARCLAAHDDRIWVGDDQELRAYDDGLRLCWSRWLGTALTASPRLVDGRLVAPGANGHVYALDPHGGAVLWSARLGAPAEGPLAVVGSGVVVAGTSAGDLVGLDEGGRVLWRQALSAGSPARVAAAGGRLYAAGGGSLYAFDPAPSAGDAGDTLWWEGRAGDDKTGWGWHLWRREGDALHLEAYAVGWRHGFVRQRTAVVLDGETLALRRAEGLQLEGSQTLSRTAAVGPDSVRIERRLAGGVESWSAPLPPGAIAAAAVPRWIERHLAGGGRDTVLVVDHETGLTRPLAVAAEPDSDGLVARLRYGQALPPPPPAAADLPPDLTPDLELVLRLGPDGRPTFLEAPALGTIESRVDAERARGWVGSRPPSRLRLDAAVADPGHLDSLRIRLPAALGDPARLFVADERQRVWVDSSGASLVVRRQSLPRHPLTLGELSGRADLAPYLAPSLHVQADDPRIRALAARLVPPSAGQDSWAAARALHDWVHDHMVPADTNVRFKSALEVLDDLEGTCSEYAVLFVALSRAAGIPARVTVGYAVATDGELVLHIWPQVFVGEWVEVDPSWNAFPVEAAHIKTGQGLLHPAHLERLNLPLEWIAARADTLRLVEYGSGGGPPYLAAAESLHADADLADRRYDEPAAQEARYALAAMPWNRRSAEALADIARTHLDRGELEEVAFALDRLERLDPDGPQADAALLYRSRLAEQRADPGAARQFLERLVERYPDGDRADDALGRLGEIVEKGEGCGRARPYYERLAQAYAGSGWAAVAESALRRCAEREAAGRPPP